MPLATRFRTKAPHDNLGHRSRTLIRLWKVHFVDLSNCYHGISEVGAMLSIRPFPLRPRRRRLLSAAQKHALEMFLRRLISMGMSPSLRACPRHACIVRAEAGLLPEKTLPCYTWARRFV